MDEWMNKYIKWIEIKINQLYYTTISNKNEVLFNVMSRAEHAQYQYINFNWITVHLGKCWYYHIVYCACVCLYCNKIIERNRIQLISANVYFQK